MKEKVLTFLKSQAGQYVSGEAISQQLGVTRASVWKMIRALREQGYSIHSVPSKGYLLMDLEGVFNQEEIQTVIRSNTIWKTAHYFKEITSTNDYAKQIGGSLIEKGTLIVADIQTSGRGRLGRHWESPSKTGLWMSLLVKPPFAPSHASKLTQLAALAVSRTLKNLCDLENHIKWPNDIHIQGKKVCGILTEMNAELSGINYLIIGIGVNVNTEAFPDELKDVATSLYLEKGQKINRLALLQAIIHEFEMLYLTFEQTLTLSAIREELVLRSNIVGHRVQIQHNNALIEAIAVDIDQEGNLILDNDGVRQPIFYGEVQRVRKI